jgi:hypothetical protein
MVTAPKPVAELAGLVYSETPREVRTDPEAHLLPWYRSPTTLAGIALAFVVWTRPRPVVVEDPAATTAGDQQPAA